MFLCNKFFQSTKLSFYSTTFKGIACYKFGVRFIVLNCTRFCWSNVISTFVLTTILHKILLEYIPPHYCPAQGFVGAM